MKISLVHNIPGVPNNLPSLSFGQQIGHLAKVQEFKNGAKSIHLSQKRKTYKKALREFKDLYKPNSFYVPGFHVGSDIHDDSFEVFYV